MNSEWNLTSIGESSDDRAPWKVETQERPSGLSIVLSNRIYILPWCQFIYAEGSADEVRIAFTTHDVLINGSHLDLLIDDLCAQKISQLRKPGRLDKFGFNGGVIITGISVRKVES